jgi:hypothetical protein
MNLDLRYHVIFHSNSSARALLISDQPLGDRGIYLREAEGSVFNEVRINGYPSIDMDRTWNYTTSNGQEGEIVRRKSEVRVDGEMYNQQGLPLSVETVPYFGGRRTEAFFEFVDSAQDLIYISSSDYRPERSTRVFIGRAGSMCELEVEKVDRPHNRLSVNVYTNAGVIAHNPVDSTGVWIPYINADDYHHRVRTNPESLEMHPLKSADILAFSISETISGVAIDVGAGPIGIAT